MRAGSAGRRGTLVKGAWWGVFAYPLKKVKEQSHSGSIPTCVRQRSTRNHGNSSPGKRLVDCRLQRSRGVAPAPCAGRAGGKPSLGFMVAPAPGLPKLRSYDLYLAKLFLVTHFSIAHATEEFRETTGLAVTRAGAWARGRVTSAL